MAISGAVRAFIRANHNVPNPVDLRTGVASDYVNDIFTFADGVGAGQNDLVWSDIQSIASGAGFPIDLTGALVNVWGAAVVFVEVTGIIIYNPSGAAGENLTVGPNTGAEPFLGPWVAANDRNVIQPEGLCMMYSDEGWPVVLNVSDKIVINNTGAALNSPQILIVGRSA